MSVVPALFSLDAYITPTNFSAWDTQGTLVAEKIFGVYKSFLAAYDSNLRELLREVVIGEDGEESSFGLLGVLHYNFTGFDLWGDLILR